MPEFDHYSYILYSYSLLKKMGRDLTSTSLTAYLKYSFDIEDGFSNSKPIKQYGSSYSLPDLEQHESSYNLLTQWDPGEKPLQPPLFRKAIATKIIYFLWIQSEYNLSCMISQYWELIKIFPMITNLLMTCGPTTLFPRPAFMETPMLSYYMAHHTQVSITYRHTHTIIFHISTYYTCQHKSMPHPPQEGSNRSLAYCTLLGVLW